MSEFAFVHWDASNLAAMFDGTSGKLMVQKEGIEPGNDCVYCDAGMTPLHLTFRITAYSACACQRIAGSSNRIGNISLVDLLGDYELTQDAVNPCKWTYSQSGSWGSADIFSDACVTKVGSVTFDTLKIEVTKIGAGGARVDAWFVMSDASLVHLVWIDESTPTDCIAIAARTYTASCPSSGLYFATYLMASIAYEVKEGP